MNQPLVAILVDAVVALAVITAAVVLSALGKIDGQSTIAVIGIGVALISGTGKAAVALYAPPPRSVPPPPPAQ